MMNTKLVFLMSAVCLVFIMMNGHAAGSQVSYSTFHGYISQNNNHICENIKNPMTSSLIKNESTKQDIQKISEFNQYLKSKIIQTNIVPTDLTVCNVHGTTNHYVFIKAILTDNHGKPIPNRTITFQIEGDPNTYVAVTSNFGSAILYYYASQTNGVYQIHADFDGDSNYSPSSCSNKLTIENI